MDISSSPAYTVVKPTLPTVSPSTTAPDLIPGITPLVYRTLYRGLMLSENLFLNMVLYAYHSMLITACVCAHTHSYNRSHWVIVYKIISNYANHVVACGTRQTGSQWNTWSL